MAYAIAVKRLDRGLHRIIWEKKSRAYNDKFKAEVFLKDWKKKHPHEELAIIEV